MAKAMKNAGVSVLLLVGSLLYLYVASNALGGNLVSGNGNMFLGGAATVLWAIGLLASIGLFFGSLGSFAWGWQEMGVGMAMRGSQIGGVALAVAAVTVAGASWNIWLAAVVVGFILSWIGIAMAWKETMGNKK
ncbi:MAG: hypothetical protein KGH61_01215 [Candidatus Micrarchaeota archaeon]|nr:hypothetical protein [Candidatus Micrarchaeota archaeon]MDE1847551.1 hypothetical protein [Candidatus Micrarchaeota archaeon]MDE1864268.1 hypothetical protein [Candidatus Micrarchaeota archaeon]